MPRDPDCVFCKIVTAQIPSHVVYEDPYVLAFLDIGPLADGHLLIIPRDHYVNLTDAPPEVGGRVGSVLPILGRACLTVTGAPGFNVLCNQGRVAGQVVGHVHFHIIPRAESDQLGYRWNPKKYAPGRDAEIAAAYQKAIVRPKS